jgi:hypothetical protein
MLSSPSRSAIVLTYVGPWRLTPQQRAVVVEHVAVVDDLDVAVVVDVGDRDRRRADLVLQSRWSTSRRRRARAPSGTTRQAHVGAPGQDLRQPSLSMSATAGYVSAPTFATL